MPSPSFEHAVNPFPADPYPENAGPHPFRTYVLKVHSRCDLSCDYCYVYRSADQGWRLQPRTMTREVATRTAERIAEHARAHRLGVIDVVLHGGEPLLCGPELIGDIVTTVRGAVAPETRVRVCVQTNALRLDSTYLQLFERLDVAVGISIDGDRKAHDRHRRTASGAGSHAKTSAAIRKLAEHRRLFGGLLCTVDLRNDPISTYEALLGFAPPAIDFLLPHGNWSAPPSGRSPRSTATPYADWLAAIFDRWYKASPRETGIRLFEEIIHLLLGGQPSVEGIGLTPANIVVIETDGSIQQIDALKTTYDGASGTGLHVRTDSLDSALLTPGFVARQSGTTALSAECVTCPVLRVCGAGHYAHRYRAGHGFVNPSVYCPDLYRLILHVRDRMATDLSRLRADLA